MGTATGAPPRGTQQTAGALGLGTVKANAVSQSFKMVSLKPLDHGPALTSFYSWFTVSLFFLDISQIRILDVINSSVGESQYAALLTF